MIGRPPLLLVLLAFGCGGAELSGATSVRAGQEPHPSSAASTFAVVSCRDAAGGKATTAARLWLVQTGSERELLVVAREGHDSIIVSNRAVLPDTGATVFQFFTDDGDGPVLLHDVRFPRDARGVARLSVTYSFSESSGGKLAVPAPGRYLLGCELRAPRPTAER